MNADIQAKLDVIKQPAQVVIDAADSIPALVDVAVASAKDEGFKAGAASIVLPAPTDPTAQYTQAQMDAAFVQAKSEQLAVDQPIIDGLNAQLAANPDKAALDLAKQQLDAMQIQVASLQADLAAKDQSLAAFKQAELDKLTLLEADFKA